MKTHIRKATEADIGSLVRFNMLLALESEGKQLNEEVLHKGVVSLFSDRMQGFYLLAEVNGTVAGQLMITYETSDWRNGIFWWIQSVYVEKEFRKQGVFRALYNWVEEQAHADKECCGLRLYVEMENLSALEIYLHLGMQKTHYYLLEKDFRVHGA